MELCSFLGVANTLLRFIPMYAQHAALLPDLLKGSLGKQDQLQWSQESIKAFQNLKDLLKSPQVLHIPDPRSPVILHSDWSTNAIRGWISQEKDGVEYPIAFESCKLHPVE